MIPCLRRFSCATVLLTVVLGSLHQTAFGQTVRAPLDHGFARSSSIVVNVNEMLGTRSRREEGEPVLGPGYPALWIAEVQFKPPRMRRMPVTDPTTKKTSNELVWYMVYRVIPRDYTDLAGSADEKVRLQKRLADDTVDPQNKADEVRAGNLMMPRFILKTTDEGSRHDYVDEVNRQIQKAVFKREFRRDAANLQLLSSIEAISTVKSQVAADDPDALNKALYGVAIWRNVDPNTDFFNVEMYGFTNLYRLTATDDGKIQVEDKCIVQEFGRPGDNILQDEKEFRVKGDPIWDYKAREDKFDLPDALSVLRNPLTSY